MGVLKKSLCTAWSILVFCSTIVVVKYNANKKFSTMLLCPSQSKVYHPGPPDSLETCKRTAQQRSRNGNEKGMNQFKISMILKIFGDFVELEMKLWDYMQGYSRTVQHHEMRTIRVELQ